MDYNTKGKVNKYKPDNYDTKLHSLVKENLNMYTKGKNASMNTNIKN